MLHVENASLAFSSKTLFRNLHLHLEGGQILQVVGPNGIGKSSLLRVLAGFTPFSSGTMKWNVPSKDIAYLPQLANMSFHIHLTLRDVLKISLLKHYKESSVLDLGFLNSQSLDLNWNSASGGERQRTLITRSFLSSAKVLLLDEPTNHLDKDKADKVLAHMHHYIANKDKAIVFVSHKPSLEFTDASIRALNLKDYV